jgi:peptidoglycan hydrolase-like protein with peptidoglycan-binding domain
MGSKANRTNREGVMAVFKKIVQILVLSLISVFLVALPVTAQTAKEPAPAGKAMASSEVKAAKAVPSDVVKAVQEALKKEGYKVKVDGLMGKHTRTALKRYQKKNGLKVTGKTDEATLAKLGVK